MEWKWDEKFKWGNMWKVEGANSNFRMCIHYC